MTEKTLYISDLDGTLLAPGACLTPKTVDILGRLIDAGGLFTAATARILIGLNLLDLSGVKWNVPFVLGNGSMLYDMSRRKVVETRALSPDTIRRVLDICAGYGKTPLLYQVHADEVMGVSTGVTSEGERAFMDKRNARFPGCIRILPAYEPETGGFYFSMQDTREKMEALAAGCPGHPDRGVSGRLYGEQLVYGDFPRRGGQRRRDAVSPGTSGRHAGGCLRGQSQRPAHAEGRRRGLCRGERPSGSQGAGG